MEHTLDEQLEEINRTFKMSDDLFHDLALRLGLSDSAFEILYALCLTGGCTQRDICRMSYTPKQTIHSALRRLEREGLLSAAPAQGREVFLSLTPRGAALAEERIRPVLERERAAFALLTARERKELLRLNKKYLELLRGQLGL
ncbi:MAG: winged helix DNA-binding protein [Lawsonibacter sp.]|nr:winged helix DNA-binding protein [Lawsonibacter sp.]